MCSCLVVAGKEVNVMNKQKVLLEFFTPQTTVLESVVDEKSGERAVRVQVKWQHADKINANGRLYRKELLAREMEVLRPAMAEGAVFGASYHPPEQAEVDDVSHIWESYSMAPDGECVGVVKVLPTTRGKNAQVILLAGGKLGMSSRGKGTLVKKSRAEEGKGTVEYEEVADDYKMQSPGDFVLSPSVIDAGTRQIMESRWNDIEDSEESKETNTLMDIKTLEELRAAYPTIVKSLDEENAALKSQVEEMGDELKALTEDAATLLEEYEGLVDGIRMAVGDLIELNGVIPEEGEEEPEDEEGAEAAEGAPESEEAAPPKEDESLKAELKKAQDELSALKETIAKKAIQEAVAAELAKLLGEEDEARRGLMRAEVLDAAGAPLAESVEKLNEIWAAAKTKVSNTIVEIERAKIVATGIAEKGHVAAEPSAVAVTEEKAKALWLEAKAAGYRGDLLEYKRIVLHIK